MTRRTRFALLAGGILLVAAVAASVMLRAPLLEAVLRSALAARGIPAAQLSVESVGWRETTITDLNLGAGGELRAGRVRVVYDPFDLVAGRIEAVALDGPTLVLDLSGDGPILGGLQPLLTGPEPGGGAPPPVPPVTLSDGRIEARTPLGAVTALVAGALRPEPGGALALSLRFDVEGEPGRVRGTLDATRAADQETTGTLVLRDGALALPGAEVRGLRGDATFAATGVRLEAASLDLTLGEIAVPGAAFEQARLSLRLTEARLDLDADLRTADGNLAVTARASLDDVLGRPSGEINLDAEVGAEAALWPLLALPAPTKGRAVARFTAHGRLPPLADLARRDLGKLSTWPRDGFEARATLALLEVSYPDRIEGVSGEVEIASTLDAGTLELRLPGGGRVTAAAVSSSWLQSLGVPGPLADTLTTRPVLTLRARGAAPFRLRATPRDGGADLELNGALHLDTGSGGTTEASGQGTLRLGTGGQWQAVEFGILRIAASQLAMAGIRLKSAEVTGTLAGTPGKLIGALDLAVAADELAFAEVRASEVVLSQAISLRMEDKKIIGTASKAGKISARRFAYGRILAGDAPLAATIAAAEATIAWGEPEGAILEHRMTLAPENIRVSVPREGGARLPIRAQAKRVHAAGTYTTSGGYSGRVRLEDAGIVLPEQEVAVERLDATLRIDPSDPILLSFEAGALRHRAEPPLIAPLSLHGEVRRAGDALEFSAEGVGPGGVGQVALSGRHRTDNGRGSLLIALAPLVFAPGGLQPGSLFPALADLRDVTGSAKADATLTWTPEGSGGTAALKIDEVSLESEAARVEGLSLDLRLNQLQPPASAPGQMLSVRRIDPGVPLDDLSARFQVKPGNPPAIAIDTAELFLTGGRFFLEDVIVDPAVSRQDLPLQVEALDLAQVLSLLGVEGLSGEGRLSGSIPLRVDDGSLRIANGRLAAAGPGIVRLHSAYANDVLAGAGESANLMLQALEDFHYDELTIAIDQPAENQARVGLVMLGNNPKVLEGHPFRFNINLETDPGKLLTALREAYRISNRAIRQIWMFGR